MKRHALVLLILVTVAIGAWADTLNLSLPSRDPGVVVPLLRVVPRQDAYPRVQEILGQPDMDVGSAFHVYLYTLSDQSQITVSTDGAQVFYIGLIANHKNLPLYNNKKKT
jgi:hypothetical protein